MDCRQAATQMQECLDEDLSVEEEQLLRAHLAACAACSRAFQRLSAIARALAGLPAFSLSPELRARILTAWAAQRRLRTWRISATAAALALVSCVMALGLWFCERSLSPENGLTALDLLLDPDRTVGLVHAKLASLGVVCAQWWSAASVWLKPLSLGITGGTAVTVLLVAIMLSAFLVISLIDRVRPATQLGRYL